MHLTNLAKSGKEVDATLRRPHTVTNPPTEKWEDSADDESLRREGCVGLSSSVEGAESFEACHAAPSTTAAAAARRSAEPRPPMIPERPKVPTPTKAATNTQKTRCGRTASEKLIPASNIPGVA